MLLRWIARTYEVDADYATAADCAERAVATAELGDDRNALGHALNVLAAVRWRQGDLDDAERLFHEALEARHEHHRSAAPGRRDDQPRIAGEDPRRLPRGAPLLRGGARARAPAFAARQHPRHAEQPGHRQHGAAPARRGGGCVHRGADDRQRARRALDPDPARGELRRAADREGRLRGGEAPLRPRDGARGASRRLARQRARRRRSTASSRARRATSPQAEAHLVARARDGARGERPRARGRREPRARRAVRSRSAATARRCRRSTARTPASRSSARATSSPTSAGAWRGSRATSSTSCGSGASRSNRRTCTRRVTASAWPISPARWRRRPGSTRASLFWFRIGALLHDVGKLIVPAEVLNKPGKLTDEEWALMRQHPAAGVEMLADVEFPWDVAPMVRSHHERWDGQGYPDGLAGEEIPLAARILCIADVYDALTTERSYKRAFSHLEAMEIMRRESGAPVRSAAVREVRGAGAARHDEHAARRRRGRAPCGVRVGSNAVAVSRGGRPHRRARAPRVRERHRRRCWPSAAAPAPRCRCS